MGTPLRRDDTVIGQLRVRGSFAAGTRLEQALASASWPTLADDSWVFIRALHSKATKHELVPALLAQTRQLLAGAGSNQQIQRFANLHELLAHLLTDLARGQASQHWYWQHWRDLFAAPPSVAIRRLLVDHLLQWPSITAQLQRQQSLAVVWCCLTESDARQLLEELFFTLAVNPRGSATTNFQAAELPLPPTALALRWQPVLQRLAIADPRRLLALAVMAQEFSPLALRHFGHQWLSHLDSISETSHSMNPASGSKLPAQHPQTSVAAPAAEQLVIENSAGTQINAPPHRASESPHFVVTDNSKDSGEAALRHRQITATAPAEAKPTDQNMAPIKHHPVAQPVSDSDPLAAQHSVTPPNRSHQSAPVRIPQASKEPAKLRWQQAVDQPAVALDHFHTRFGGLLFLLNFLNRSEPQQLMAQHWQALPNAWCWLFRLGEVLHLDQSDPIAGFIANQSGLETVAALSQSPALPAAADLLALAERWYRPTELWQASLLHLDAEIRYSASHCDLHAKLTQVRLPLRLAGLDINPGWLPWLGRVVTFHYH